LAENGTAKILAGTSWNIICISKFGYKRARKGMVLVKPISTGKKGVVSKVLVRERVSLNYR
jgi:hypothetical protein